MIYLPAIIAVLVSSAMVPVSMWLARKFGTMDQADARKIHIAPTPRLGGIAIIAGTICGVLGTVAYGSWSGVVIPDELLRKLIAICGAGLFIFAVGLFDDLRTISSRFKLVALLGAAATVCGGGVLLSDFILGGKSLLHLGWTSWPVTMLWIVGVAVALNFIDGLDGLAGGIALLCSATAAMFLAGGGNVTAAILPISLSGALVGFLFYNWHPAKTFMGDCGSMTIGFLLASTIVLANALEGTMEGFILPSLALGIPLLDTALTIFRRRYLQRRSMFAAERGHIHHRLLDRGLSHPQTVMVLHLVSLAAVCIGCVSLLFEDWATLGGLALLIPLYWGLLQLAGSMRTNEMMTALRTKRDFDRTARRYRSTFEDMQLEFHHVKNFSQWWEGVCRAAHRLEFINVTLKMPAGNEAQSTTDSEREREFNWTTDCPQLPLCDAVKASIPVMVTDADGPTATLSVQIAATHSLESAGQRLALFSRLITEYSISRIRTAEQAAFKRRKQLRAIQHSLAGRRSELANDGQFANLRVAVVHDFLYTYCGAERVLEQIIKVVPHCDVYSLFDFMPEDQRGFLQGKTVTTSLIQKLPFARRMHRNYLPLMPFAVEQMDLSGYDLIISSSYLAAKGVLTGPDQLHVSYCHSPVRFAWDLHHHYLNEAGLGFGPKGLLARAILHYIRSWDVRSSLGVDQFIANSRFVARRIQKVYRRKAVTIHPPVDTSRFILNDASREDFYLVVGRMVPYKRTDLIVETFRDLPDRKLVVIGEGPEMNKVRALAGPNVEILGFLETAKVIDYMQRAKALIFAAEEDFGILPVEALACGTPVIAFGRGGVTETVIEGEHGVYFDQQTPESIVEAIDRFESESDFGKFSPAACRARSMQFSTERFTDEFKALLRRRIEKKWPVQNKAVVEKASDPQLV